jgi:hypothetical protein
MLRSHPKPPPHPEYTVARNPASIQISSLSTFNNYRSRKPMQLVLPYLGKEEVGGQHNLS